MRKFTRFHWFHWSLAGLFVLAYLTGDDAGLAHAWLGYGLIALIIIRVAIVLMRINGFPRILPNATLRKGIAAEIWGKTLIWGMVAALILISLTGVLMVDNAALINAGLQLFIPPAQAESIGNLVAGLPQLKGEEIHEMVATLSLGLIALHVGWLMVYRRKMVWFLLGGTHTAKPAEPSRSAVQHDNLSVCELRRETQDAITIVLALPAERRWRFQHQPGQHLTIGVDIHGMRHWRCYSITSLPGEATLAITVKRVAGGLVSNWLHEGLRVGMTVAALPPAGQFHPRMPAGDLLLLAGGSGITPLYSILRYVLSQSQGRVRLIYVSQQADNVIFRQQLASLQDRYAQRLVATLWITEDEGRIDADRLEILVRDWMHTEAFLCGPDGLMSMAQTCLTNLGMPPAALHRERFAVGRQAAGMDSRAASARVSLHGKQHAIVLDEGATLLHAMERQGLQAPSHCRAGMCGSCRCKVSEGRVAMRSNLVLSQEEVEAGWALACQAEAQTSVLTVSFDDTAGAASSTHHH